MHYRLIAISGFLGLGYSFKLKISPPVVQAARPSPMFPKELTVIIPFRLV